MKIIRIMPAFIAGLLFLLLACDDRNKFVGRYEVKELYLEKIDPNDDCGVKIIKDTVYEVRIIKDTATEDMVIITNFYNLDIEASARIDEGLANYPQKVQTLLLPAVMLIAWQLFTAFYRKRKQILASALSTIGIFLALQVIFMLLLTAYHTSSAAKYIYDVMLDAFYIIALGIIILDYIRYPVRLREGFSFKSKKQVL